MFRCEFCGEDKKYVESTSMTGLYCEECLELTIAECIDALAKIEKERNNDLQKQKKASEKNE